MIFKAIIGYIMFAICMPSTLVCFVLGYVFGIDYKIKITWNQTRERLSCSLLIMGSRKATDPQIQYLRKLMTEAFAKRYTHGNRLDANHLEGTDFGYASKCIADLKAAKARGWTVLETVVDDSGVAAKVTEIKARRAAGLPYHKNEKGEWI